MHRIHELWAALVGAAFTVLALPALVLAQAQPGGAPANPPPGGGGGLPANPPGTGTGGSSSWLWILIALAVVAVIWYALSARRTATRTR
jgi:hypothetical protein